MMCDNILLRTLPSAISKLTPFRVNCIKNPDQLGFKSKLKDHLDLKPQLNDDVKVNDSKLVKELENDGMRESSKKVKVIRKGKQVMKRSSMVPKQVISMETALSLGFVSQLWVDTASWVVSVVEVRPNLLSGEAERFLLKDIRQVGDVVLVENDGVLECDLKMVGLETLVGYRVVTSGQRNMGKVRGYSFNINSGAVESLELDSFGISIIPSSLVSTYALFTEDVLEVGADTVVVHEAAVSSIQRLTKGFLDTNDTRISLSEDAEYEESEESSTRSRRSRNKRRNLHSQGSKIGAEDDWELPMDYL